VTAYWRVVPAGFSFARCPYTGKQVIELAGECTGARETLPPNRHQAAGELPALGERPWTNPGTIPGGLLNSQKVLQAVVNITHKPASSM
jgi:hypothetical protein